MAHLNPIILRGDSDPDSDLGPIPDRPGKRKEKRTMTRPPLAPDPPALRGRSIFYFDRQELMEENAVLEAEIARLTGVVGRLREIVEQHQPKKPKENPKVDLRTDCIYHPPGLALKRKPREG
jgi:hypothetical protein